VQPARAGARLCLRRRRLERRRGLAQKLVSLAKLDRLGQLEQKVHFFAGERVALHPLSRHPLRLGDLIGRHLGGHIFALKFQELTR
jgi:hypothetical protein